MSSRKLSLAFGFAVLILLLISAYFFLQPEPATATLVISQGQATILNPVLLSKEKEISAIAGEIVTVRTGTTIHVGSGAFAQLRLYDGSTVDLLENTQLHISDLYNQQGDYSVQLKMLSGRTVNRVRRILGVDEIYKIETPSSVISVRGTVFIVEVIDSETTYIACDEGLVEIIMESQSAQVKPGEALTTTLGQPMQAPIPQSKPESPALPTPQPNPITIEPTPLPVSDSPAVSTPAVIDQQSPGSVPSESAAPPAPIRTAVPPDSSLPDNPPATASDVPVATGASITDDPADSSSEDEKDKDKEDKDKEDKDKEDKVKEDKDKKDKKEKDK